MAMRARVGFVVGMLVAVLLPVGSAGAAGPSVTRLWGPDRYQTAVAVSKAMYPSGASRVYVATGLDFPDALAAGGGLPGPVLLTQHDTVPSAVLAEVQRLKPSEVFVIGGVGVIADAVVTQLTAAGSWTVTRLWGADRYRTAIEVSTAMYPSGASRVYVATGLDFPDALAAGGGLPGPVLLTAKDSVPAGVLSEIKRLKPADVFIIGGVGVVSDAVKAQIAGAGSWTVRRLWGADRYRTAIEVSTAMYPSGASRVYVATGLDFPDALAAGGGLPGPVLLTAKDQAPEAVVAEILRLNPSEVVLVGGTGVIADAVRTQIEAALAGTDDPTQRAALMALYFATGGPSWTDRTGWLTAASYCSWHGVTCAFGTTEIVAVELASNALTGYLPAAVADLTHLQTLNLSSNSLTGPIPASLGSLTKLGTLWLFSNQLSGQIPSSLGDLSALGSLWLFDNQLSGSIPWQLGNLTSLATLDLSGNALSGSIPSSLGTLPNLTYLGISNTGLTGAIPDSLGSLPKLQWLYLNQNHLSGPIPGALGSISTLKGLGLAGNDLTGAIPVQLRALTNLQELDLSTNGLSGAIPAQLGQLAALQSLLLASNQLSGAIPPQLGNLALLQLLNLSSNQLSGSVPPELMNLDSTLDTLWLYGQTGCLTASTTTLAAWLAGFDPTWNDGCP